MVAVINAIPVIVPKVSVVVTAYEASVVNIARFKVPNVVVNILLVPMSLL